MPKFVARWVQHSDHELEFEADDMELAEDHIEKLEADHEYLPNADFDLIETELVSIEEVSSTEDELRKLFEWVIEQASQGNADFPDVYVAKVDAIMQGVHLEYEDDEVDPEEENYHEPTGYSHE